MGELMNSLFEGQRDYTEKEKDFITQFSKTSATVRLFLWESCQSYIIDFFKRGELGNMEDCHNRDYYDLYSLMSMAKRSNLQDCDYRALLSWMGYNGNWSNKKFNSIFLSALLARKKELSEYPKANDYQKNLDTIDIILSFQYQTVNQ